MCIITHVYHMRCGHIGHSNFQFCIYFTNFGCPPATGTCPRGPRVVEVNEDTYCALCVNAAAEADMTVEEMLQLCDDLAGMAERLSPLDHPDHPDTAGGVALDSDARPGDSGHEESPAHGGHAGFEEHH